jgi:hypothetical protein
MHGNQGRVRVLKVWKHKKSRNCQPVAYTVTPRNGGKKRVEKWLQTSDYGCKRAIMVYYVSFVFVDIAFTSQFCPDMLAWYRIQKMNKGRLGLDV